MANPAAPDNIAKLWAQAKLANAAVDNMEQQLDAEAQLMAEAQVSMQMPPDMRAVKIGEVKADILRKWKANELPPEFDQLIGDTLWFVRPLQELTQGGPLKSEGAAASEDPTQRAFQLAALQTLATVLSNEAAEAMSLALAKNISSPGRALFALATKLLYAVLAFRGEGNCVNALCLSAINQASEGITWAGLDPQGLLSQWFSFQTSEVDPPSKAILNVFSGAPLRASFEAAAQGQRAQFLCALSRVEALELVTGSRQVRSEWAAIFELYPEVETVRALFGSLKGRCWEDARDRSKSRSRSREKKKSKKPEPESKSARGSEGRLSTASVRFFVKGTDWLEDQQLGMYFKKFGQITECNIVRDKKTKRSRGMAFVGITPSGVYRGKTNTKEMMTEWVLEQKHSCQGVLLEVSAADKKTPEIDEKKKEQLREQRIDERRVLREQKEQRSTLASAAEELLMQSMGVVPDHLVPSPWAKKWRLALVGLLPAETDVPLAFSDPKLREACSLLWNETVEYLERIGGHRDALSLFRADHVAEASPWAFVPASNLIALVGSGLVGFTSGGVFKSDTQPEAFFPFATPKVTPMQQVQQVQHHNLSLHGRGGQAQHFPVSANVRRGTNESAKIFVGGLTRETGLEQLTDYFGHYGPITDAVVMMDKLTGTPRGFGFVVFENAVQVDRVMEDYDNHRIDDKWVEVKRATAQEQVQVVSAPGVVEPENVFSSVRQELMAPPRGPFSQVTRTWPEAVPPTAPSWATANGLPQMQMAAPTWAAAPVMTPPTMPPQGFGAGAGWPAPGESVGSQPDQYDPFA